MAADLLSRCAREDVIRRADYFIAAGCLEDPEAELAALCEEHWHRTQELFSAGVLHCAHIEHKIAEILAEPL